MRFIFLILICILPALGCETFDAFANTRVENPVMPDPPMRVAGAVQRSSTDQKTVSLTEMRTALTDVKTVSFDGSSDPMSTLTAESVVATVNGAPVFAGEILDPYVKMFDEAQAKGATPADMSQAKEVILRRDLQHHIERKLLVDTMRRGMKKEQLEMLDDVMTKAFNQYVDDRMKEAGVTSRVEFEQKMLEETGNSLDHLRMVFQTSTMAREYLRNQAKVEKTIGRPELLDYYNEHRESYAIAARVRWRRISVSFNKPGGKREAYSLVEKVVTDLKQGKDFSEVASQYSDGPKASKGGNWGWTELGGLKDQTVEKELFQIQINTISQIMTSENEFIIVQVLDREPAKYESFVDVQEKIRKKLETEIEEQAKKKVLDDLVEKAMITTIFDNKAGNDSADDAARG